MSGLRKIKRALISVSDKEEIVGFTRELKKFGVEIISTGGTARALSEAGIEVTEVSSITEFPEMMDGRVKTLHPKIHGSLLALRDNVEHQKAMLEHGIEPIDLVVVNLYPFEETIQKEEVTIEEAVENIDIGGPAMIRSAAKNWRDVAVIVDPELYQMFINQMKKNNGAITLSLRQSLAALAFVRTATYDAEIADYLQQIESFSGFTKREILTLNNVRSKLTSAIGLDDEYEFEFDDDEEDYDKIPDEKIQEAFEKLACGNGSAQSFYVREEEDELFPEENLSLIDGKTLRYGENPHQKAAVYELADETGGVAQAEILQGKEMSFNNYLDADAAWRLIGEFDEAACAIIKHTNPSGVGLGENLREAYKRALSTDPVSAFGGIVAFNRTVDAETAEAMTEVFTEVVVAPDFAPDALQIFSQRKNLRVLKVEKILCDRDNMPSFDYRRISGGMLLQTIDDKKITEANLKVVTKRKPTEEEVRAMLFAWRVCKHVKSNAIVFANEHQTIGVGAGQMNRVDSVRIAAMRAQRFDLPLKNCVIASDAFFPFRDSVDEAAKFGVSAIIQPGGSMRDEESIRAADEHGIAMVFTGIRHFRH